MRLPFDDAGALIEAAERLDRLVDHLAADPSDVDLVLDAADAQDVDPGIAHELVVAAMQPEPDGTRWRSVTLTASSLPHGVSSFRKNATSRHPRRDWTLGTDVARRMHGAALQLPDFGDYGIFDPAPPDTANPRFASIPTALRYSVDDD